MGHLKLLRREELQGGQYIELSTGNGNQGDPGSVYIRDPFAALFNPEFERANHAFSFFGMAEFNDQQLEDLVSHLEANQSALNGISNYEGLIEFVSRPSVPYKTEALLQRRFPNVKDVWPQLMSKYKSVNLEVIDLIKPIRGSTRILRVIGL